MLAVVFWHIRKPDCEISVYRKNLINFHQSLKDLKPDQFRYSAVFETSNIPWLPSDYEVFEDWYVMLKFAGMDSLNQAVLEVAHSTKLHDILLDKVMGASGSFFGFEDGTPRVSKLENAIWFDKPGDCKIEYLLAKTGQEGSKADYSFWTRAMAAGPAANCLLTKHPFELPEEFSPLYRKRKLLWANGDDYSDKL